MTYSKMLSLVLAVSMGGMLAGALSSCTNKQLIDTQQPLDGSNPASGQPYERTVDIYSAGDSEYTGFYNNFEYKAVLLNTVVREAQTLKQAAYYQWDAEKTGIERAKVLKELSEETRIFMSFFTPDRNNDNLTNAKSIWRIYLDVAGKRYEGKIKRNRGNLAELQALYPAHTRWTTPYEVSFPVPTRAIEREISSYTVTGPLGTRAVKFAPVK